MLGVVSVVLWWMCHARRSRAPGGPSHCEEERVEEDFAVYMSPSGRQHKFPGYNQSRCDDLAAVIREEINQRWERMKSRHIIEKNRIEYETPMAILKSLNQSQKLKQNDRCSNAGCCVRGALVDVPCSKESSSWWSKSLWGGKSGGGFRGLHVPFWSSTQVPWIQSVPLWWPGRGNSRGDQWEMGENEKQTHYWEKQNWIWNYFQDTKEMFAVLKAKKMSLHSWCSLNGKFSSTSLLCLSHDLRNHSSTLSSSNDKEPPGSYSGQAWPPQSTSDQLGGPAPHKNQKIQKKTIKLENPKKQ